jgi:hypothetical protein
VKVKNWKSTEQQLEERKKNTIDGVEGSKINMSADQLRIMRMMTNMFTTDENQSKVFEFGLASSSTLGHHIVSRAVHISLSWCY